MVTAKIVSSLIFFALAISLFFISYLHFTEKGNLLFNNAYIWASKEERRKMNENKENKKPHYRQSGVTFLFLGIGFLAISAYFATGWKWMYAVFGLAVIIAVVYAVVSSVKIEQRQAETRK